MIAVLVFILTSLCEFPQNLNLLALNFRNQPVLLFGFTNLDLFDSLGVLLLDILLSLYESFLDELESLCMQLFNLVFFLAPLPELLLLHELAPEVETGLVGNRRQTILKPLFFAIEFYLIEFFDAGRKS